MESCEVLMDAFSRVREVVLEVLDGLSADELAFRQDSEANSIAWLVWHLTRVQDDHVCAVAGHEQVWVTGGWAERFGLELDVLDTGYGHSPDQVAWSARGPAGRLPRGRLRTNGRVLGRTVQRRPGPGGRQALGPAGDPWGQIGERGRRRPSARRPGCLRQRPSAIKAFCHEGKLGNRRQGAPARHLYELQELAGVPGAGRPEDLACLLPGWWPVLRSPHEDKAGRRPDAVLEPGLRTHVQMDALRHELRARRSSSMDRLGVTTTSRAPKALAEPRLGHHFPKWLARRAGGGKEGEQRVDGAGVGYGLIR